ncbi:hypothetical protein KJ365_04230 [Glaciecola sp. XM2]|jgi:hypothetical protein|uniref:hypothetical protein n=1 Tax=Glaciecola sp. XM2 TaxID=1914931 RepID=UPI001BDE0FF9|nr:hypothetical protein [Glaciecola sp. XM2]MBT1450077.1 hypothetical protein [Glaciecola sp. XM2]
MIRFEQTKDAINHIHSFHVALSEYYLTLSKHHGDERVRLCLHYLSEQELKFAEEMSHYKSQASAAILNTWFQYTNDDSILQIPTSSEADSNLSLNDIISLATQFSEELMTLYNDLHEQANTDELQSVFEHLKSAQVQKNKQLSVNLDRMMDV